MEPSSQTLANLAKEEGIHGVVHEVACRKCHRHMGEIIVPEKSAARLLCKKCGAPNFLLILRDRLTVVTAK